ncbi:hypothetical protein [Tenacibaculum aiptasiae]|uniref:hypothetical protein n=1 Tax=Tenacibaculum aiptasiae TaxID=426481 RepID=UPI003B5B99C3
MKILLIGEFSGVHNNLKKGLIKEGHIVKIAANGDGFKKFDFDIKLCPYKGNNILAAVKNILHFLINIRFFIFNDIVQFINPLVVPYYFKKAGLLKLIFLLNKKTIYYACGTDIDFINASTKFKYFPFDDINHIEYPQYKNKHYETHEYFMDKIDAVIPAMYTYSFRNQIKKQKHPILLPGSTEKLNKKDFKKDKIFILFGITRRNFKGASFILEALERVNKEFNDRVDIKIIEKIPIDEYFEYLDKADILIDQCKSYDYGMNAILGMERNTIILSGAEKEALVYNNLDTCPVINIKPDAIQIYEEIKEIILMSEDERRNLKLETFNHVVKYHSNSKITAKFLKEYKKC